MVNSVGVNADYYFNHDFSAFQFSIQLMLEQALTNLIVCLMISQKLHTKVAQTS